MALPASGPLALTCIQTEFGGSNPISLNEYYAGGAYVPAGTTGTYGAVPSSGTISIQNFYGTTAVITSESVFNSPGTFSWIPPTGVTSVSFVAVGAGFMQGGVTAGGGGALGYKNNVTVTPGTSYTVRVPPRNSCYAASITINGTTYSAGSAPNQSGATSRVNMDGGGNGGNGAYSCCGGGGGGAGGYSGAGGNGGVYSGTPLATAGAGGGGGGGGGNLASCRQGGGGGVGLYGEGANGAAGGGGGSGGASSAYSCGPSMGGNFGGGGGTGNGTGVCSYKNRGTGAVRIVAPGTSRQFPSTNVGASAIGCSTFNTYGTYAWIAPAGVTSVSVVAVGPGGWANGYVNCCTTGGGGGALAYKNNISVTPGNTYTVIVGNPATHTGDSSFSGLFYASGGAGSTAGYPTNGTSTYDGGGGGGNGGPGGGAGAGGYSGRGGSGGQSGAGGGGGAGYSGGALSSLSGGGGGVGLYGEGASGAVGTSGCGAGKGGSGGGNGGVGPVGGVYGAPGGLYGGGAGSYYSSTNGAVGAVRIVWPGTSRQFPSTNVNT